MTDQPTPEPLSALDARAKTIRAHTLSLHVMGEQLSTIESWFWAHLADVRETARQQLGGPLPDDVTAAEPELSDPTQCSGDEGFCPEHGFHRHSLKQPGPEPAADWYEAGCARGCSEQHTYRYGRCALGVPPEPTVSLSRVFTAADGHPAIGFDTYTVEQLAELIEPALRDSSIPFHADYLGDLASTAAEAIIHRHAKETP